MDLRVVSDRGELESYYPAISELFARAFGKALSRPLWEQYYLDNPYGPPLVIALFEADKLVAHYGLVPQILVGADGTVAPYYLAITLMIAPEHRNTDAFVQLVRQLVETAQQRRREFILAFLNQQSFLPLTKLFGWRCLVETPFYCLGPDSAGRQSLRVTGLERLSSGSDLAPPYDSTFWGWRSRLNAYQACQVGESLQMVYKAYDERTLDVMDLDVMDPEAAPRDFRRFVGQAGFSQAVLTGYHAGKLGLEVGTVERWGDYTVRMCYCPLSSTEAPAIRFNLMLCDVY